MAGSWFIDQRVGPGLLVKFENGGSGFVFRGTGVDAYILTVPSNASTVPSRTVPSRFAMPSIRLVAILAFLAASSVSGAVLGANIRMHDNVYADALGDFTPRMSLEERDIRMMYTKRLSNFLYLVPDFSFV